MKAHRIVRDRADWIAVVEAIHSSEPDDQKWSAQIVEAMHTVFATSGFVGMYSIDHTSDLAQLDVRIDHGNIATTLLGLWNSKTSAYEATIEDYQKLFQRYHFTPAPVMTGGELDRTLDPRLFAITKELFEKVVKRGDSLGILTHPIPGRITVISTTRDTTIELTPHDRELLTRVALHLESAHRARLRPEAVLAELSSDGRVLHREANAPSTSVLQASARRAREARSRRARKDSEALALWSALLDGRASLVPRGSGESMRYLVIDNPPASRPLHALSKSEADVLGLAVRGVSTKLVAYGLGLSSSSVSSRLASAAAKVGVLSRAELVRLAAMLAPDPRANLSDDALTSAEREVLELLQRGLSNNEIAKLRSRSVRTIANQVASLLRKTKTTSRRGLLVS